MVWDDIKENPPPSFAAWELKIRESAIHNKWSPQLKEMTDLWNKKIPRLEYLLAKEEASSNTKVKKNKDGTFEIIDRTQTRLDNIATLRAKIKRGIAVIEMCKQEERIRKALELEGQVFNVPEEYNRDGSTIDVSKEDRLTLPKWLNISREPIGTTYYIDSDNGNDGNAGTSTGAAWATLAQFTTNIATAAGDIAILRNSMTANYGTGLLDFNDNGTINDRITVTRDYNNAFSDDVDLSATATATLAFGSKTVTYSSDISGVLAAGDWIYSAGDDPEEFSYEVKSVSTTTVTLYLPYLGGQEGSGKTTTNIGASPVYGTTTDTGTRFRINADFYWNIRGIEIRTNSTNPSFEIQNTNGIYTRDMVLVNGTATTSEGFGITAECSGIYIEKCRTENYRFGFQISDDPTTGEMKNCLIDGNSKANSIGLYFDGSTAFKLVQSTFQNHASSDIFSFGETTDYQYRTCTLNSTKKFDLAGTVERFAFFEDFNGTPSKTVVYVGNDGVDDDIGWESDTTTLRTGGGNKSIKVTPTTQLGEWVLLNIPIEHDTSETTYTVYVKTNATANWTADPTADELELAFEAWGHATNNYRKITKSTDVADFNGVTTWEPLAVTVTPAQAGVGYLTLKYRKPKEASVSNEFYVDLFVE